MWRTTARTQCLDGRFDRRVGRPVRGAFFVLYRVRRRFGRLPSVSGSELLDEELALSSSISVISNSLDLLLIIVDRLCPLV